MDVRFDQVYTDPENQIFRVVFFPDRIYHSRYLNATRSTRYRYNVREVRSVAEATVLKGEVYLDGIFLSTFIRIEYKATRLQEVARERGRFLEEEVLAWVKLHPEGNHSQEATVKLFFCPWVGSYQVEIWQTLQPLGDTVHDIKVLDLIGNRNAITKVPVFSETLLDIYSIKKVELSFRESTLDLPAGYEIKDPLWDNNFARSFQSPVSDIPSDNGKNTIDVNNYLVDFQRGWSLHTDDIKPVRYKNAMMNDNDERRFDDNVIEMKWVFQRELGGNLVFFHEVTIPPGMIEGTHRHIGSEELYYITQGDGIAYMAEGDDPNTANYNTVELPIYGLEKRKCKEIPVNPGSVIFTKSGGIHGIKNVSDKPLKFVAFLYHST